jgi:hypothetical protein
MESTNLDRQKNPKIEFDFDMWEHLWNVVLSPYFLPTFGL